MVRLYTESRPDVIKRLKESGMTISYHVRPPHPLNKGFSRHLGGLDDEALAALLRDYGTCKLDLSTGKLIHEEPGGYTFVADTLGHPPVAVGIPHSDPRIRKVARRVYAELGAKVVVEYHESGTKVEEPFEWLDRLLVRPSDFSATRWALSGMRREAFWWNMLSTPRGADYNPVKYLEKRLAEWSAERPPFITVLIHENNFYRRGATPWALVYYPDRRKAQPLAPPFDLDAPDASHPRPAANAREIWEAYEELVAFAASHLRVVTSDDIVRMAESVPGGARAVR